MRYVAIAIIGLLATYGGYEMTRRLAKKIRHGIAYLKMKQLKPCTCGAEYKCVGTDGHTLVVFCEECGRVIEGDIDEAIKRWNNGERDEDE